MGTYSGALLRTATPHYASRPPVAGVNPEHTHPDPDPDPFTPVPEGAGGGAKGDVWQPQDLPTHTPMVVRQRVHTTPLQPPVPSNVHSEQRDWAWQARFLANHAVDDYRPDLYPTYKHADQGRDIDWYTGRGPVEAGITVPDRASYLVMGKNAFDATNQSTEVYSGDAPNVGRYRLQANQQDFGLYQFHTKQGQDGFLRAYAGLSPQMPQDKPRVPNSAPYVPNSSGTTRWTLSQWQTPSTFALPSETSLTDYEQASGSAATGSQFDDGGRL